MWHQKGVQEVERALKTNIKYGLSENQVKRRIEEFGKNKLAEKKKESIIIRFVKQFNDFMIIILIIASIISAGISYWQGTNDYMDSIIIVLIVALNAIMGVIQEEKAEKSIESLKKLTPEMAKVIRDGETYEVNAVDLVPGDIVLLENGKFVPADGRIIESYDLKIEESSLTGETEPILKQTYIITKNNIHLGDIKNMAFMSTIVSGGHGKAIVTETGMNTKIGKIANMMIKDEAPETPIQKKLSEVGKILGVVCLVICTLIFIIGVIKKIEPIEMFMTSVGLAVAAIPEGLPAIVTIMLSIGVTRMAKKNSIIRKLPAVETLGSSSVICSDKTGTLTQNKMTVVDIYSSFEDKKFLLKLGTMCTDCLIQEKNGKKIVIGEPTEASIVNKALEENINKEDLYKKMPRIAEIQFDSTRKMMTTIHKMNNSNQHQILNLNNQEVFDEYKNFSNSQTEYRIISKGAPDILIQKCSKILINKKEEPLTIMQKNRIMDKNNKMADKALRVIAVAYKDTNSIEEIEKHKISLQSSSNTIENNLIFVGLIGMIDPPRKGVKEAVEKCRQAGIKTVMITGDHIATAKAIAKELGILEKNEEAITGQELDKMKEVELEKKIKQYSVFARVTPEHKVKIVKAWQKTGAVVAMTGDGVNDSPALKNADIGIAMGKCGTDVAKNAADMILVDDDFVTIVEAVKQGRNIYENIRKAIHFLLATNIGEIVTILLGLLLGLDTPLLAIQLLWINLVTDSFPAIALGLEKEEGNIMNRTPINPKESIFSSGLWNKIITEGFMIGSLTLLAFSFGNRFYNVEVGRTMAFLSMGLLELVHSFNIKSEKSIFKIGIFENKYLIGSFIIGTFMQTIVAIIPLLAKIFDLTVLTKEQWLITIGISIMPIIIIELQKKINNLKEKYSNSLMPRKNIRQNSGL